VDQVAQRNGADRPPTDGCAPRDPVEPAVDRVEAVGASREARAGDDPAFGQRPADERPAPGEPLGVVQADVATMVDPDE